MKLTPVEFLELENGHGGTARKTGEMKRRTGELLQDLKYHACKHPLQHARAEAVQVAAVTE